MAYATEAQVRVRLQLNDTESAPDALITACLEEAHDELLRFLDPAYDMAPIEAAVVTGETLLAGARVMRALAAGDAARQQDLQIGNHRIRPSGRAEVLSTLAAMMEKDAWYMLEPYLTALAPQVPAKATDTTPVLGARVDG